MEPTDYEEALKAWIDLQPVGLRDLLLENRKFAVQGFEQSLHETPEASAAPATAATVATPEASQPPLVPQQQEQPQEAREERGETPTAEAKRPKRRSFWTSRRGDPTFNVSRSMIQSAIARQKLSKEEKDKLKRRRQDTTTDPNPLSDMRRDDGSVDIALDPVVEVSSALFVECGDDEDDSAGKDSLTSEAAETSEHRLRSRLLPGVSSKDGSTSNLEVRLVNGIRTLLTQNLIRTDIANADRSLASYLRTPSPIAIGTETSSMTETVPKTANTSGDGMEIDQQLVPSAPPPTPVHRLVVTQPFPVVVDKDSSDSEDDVNPHTVHAARARAIAARSRMQVR